MQTNKYDKKKHEREKIEQEKRDEEIQRRKDFFEKMSKNRMFNKYIIEDIIDKAIESHKAENFDMEALLTGDPEMIRSNLLSARASLEQLKLIKKALLTGKL